MNEKEIATMSNGAVMIGRNKDVFADTNYPEGWVCISDGVSNLLGHTQINAHPIEHPLLGKCIKLSPAYVFNAGFQPVQHRTPHGIEQALGVVRDVVPLLALPGLRTVLVPVSQVRRLQPIASMPKEGCDQLKEAIKIAEEFHFKSTSKLDLSQVAR
jgi:hypothetical protein